MRIATRRVGQLALAAGLCLVGAEIASRFDDWAFQGVPFLSTPDRDYDLTIVEGGTLRGKPGGHFKKWRLNEFGFRAPSMNLSPTPGTTRVIILGSSETFGLYESPGREYPAQLAQLLEPEKIEVINAAQAGMSLKSTVVYWRNWLHQFQPHFVVLYPSPLFYLDIEAPGGVVPAAPSSPRWGSRFLPRFRDVIRQSDAIRLARANLLVQRARSRQGEEWEFVDVPADRVEAFRRDLHNLAQEIMSSGARLVVATHARKATSPPRRVDEFDLALFRVFYPRASAKTMAAFESAVNQAIREFAQSRRLPVVEADALLTGRHECFADLVHFNDQGARELAELLAKELRSVIAQDAP